MPLSFQRTIPRNAVVLHIRSDLPSRALFDTARAILATQGFGFPTVDSSRLALETDALPVGSSHSPLRISIQVTAGDAGGLLDARAQTLVGPGMWGPATNGGDGKSRVGFQELVMLLGRIPNREVSYSAN